MVVCPKDYRGLDQTARRTLKRIRRRPRLITAFWHQAELLLMSLYYAKINNYQEVEPARRQQTGVRLVSSALLPPPFTFKW